MNQIDHIAIVTWAERHAGPLGAWIANALMWLAGGASPLAVIGTLAALWWTVERARTERAKRRAIEGFDEHQRGTAKMLLQRLSKITRPAKLD